VERIPPDKMEEWLYMLEAPLPGRENKPTPIDREREGEDFMAAMAALNGFGG
jgi:hypothetical protein